MTTATARPAALDRPRVDNSADTWAHNRDRIGAVIGQMREQLDDLTVRTERETRDALEAALAHFTEDDVFDLLHYVGLNYLMGARVGRREHAARHLARIWRHQTTLVPVNARTVRAALRDAGLPGCAGRITSGRHTTRVEVPNAALWLARVEAALAAVFVEHGDVEGPDSIGRRVTALRLGADGVVHIDRHRRR